MPKKMKYKASRGLVGCWVDGVEWVFDGHRAFLPEYVDLKAPEMFASGKVRHDEPDRLVGIIMPMRFQLPEDLLMAERFHGAMIREHKRIEVANRKQAREGFKEAEQDQEMG